MGTQEEDRDWVDVANDLLSKCQLNLRLRKVTDCDASVFVALYEAILGENVPDYIAAPGSQEDDIHNIQSVIDSLALDYLQISLSHITGENIVRGDKESVKNLLEIFDGLLEYLTEQISEEESQNGEPNGAPVEELPHAPRAENQENEAMLERVSQSSSIQSAVQSSKHSLHSWNAEEIGSTNELIQLGDSARTFTAKQEEATSQPAAAPGSPDPQATLLREPLRSAIPLQPPYQTTPHRPERAPHSPSQSPLANGLSHGHAEEDAVPVTTECPRLVADTVVTNGLQSPASNHSPVESLKSASRPEDDMEQLERTGPGPRRVLFRTQPDVLFLSLQEETEGSLPPDTEGEEEEEGEMEEEEGEEGELEEEERGVAPRGQRGDRSDRERTGLGASRLAACVEPGSWRAHHNRQAEQELHHMSEKLSRRLEELDEMLKRALGESGESGEVREEDKESHHSDSVMECRRRDPQRPKGARRAPPAPRTRSLSPSPPRCRRSLQGQLQGVTRETESSRARRRSPAARSRRRELRQRRSQDTHTQLVEKAYKEELKRYEERERLNITKERLRAQEAEREYREAILRDVPRTPKPARLTTPQQRSPRTRASLPLGRRRQENMRRAAPMKVKDNDLLPQLLEELPHLHLSPHALGRMWEQQLGQVERLHSSLAEAPRAPRSKLTSQVEEAQRRHDLLVEIIHKEQEHNRRLRDFKERIQQQKSARSQLRDQRQQIARAKKYHNDYHVQHRARMMRARTKEERMFQQVFEEGLDLQTARLREQRAYVKEQRQEHHRRHRDQIQSMENYYKDQFSLLAETLAQERQEIQVRKKAQEKALQKMKRELRSKMEREIGELQKIIIQNDDEDYFRDLEVKRLRGRVQMASFQYNTSCLH
ncbi:centrosomal protein of 95 kDa-like isoform X2 [Hypomesus transpacificus]|uniref:centrosomal protein of 95 kDa-like isoform X2 n=1 Tax=Hypomesus transpacificus TaxID=137520 RepID=UPI001F0871D7|nr:centrosomal protein of 95 kDa-like isoform X2 [Hypomesus transpacificus]